MYTEQVDFSSLAQFLKAELCKPEQDGWSVSYSWLGDRTEWPAFSSERGRGDSLLCSSEDAISPSSFVESFVCQRTDCDH